MDYAFKDFFSVFSSRSFIVLGFTLKIYDLFSVFYVWYEVWIQVYFNSSTNSWESYSFSTVFPLSRCQKSVAHLYVDFFPGLYIRCVDLFVYLYANTTHLITGAL